MIVAFGNRLPGPMEGQTPLRRRTIGLASWAMRRPSLIVADRSPLLLEGDAEALALGKLMSAQFANEQRPSCLGHAHLIPLGEMKPSLEMRQGGGCCIGQ